MALLIKTSFVVEKPNYLLVENVTSLRFPGLLSDMSMQECQCQCHFMVKPKQPYFCSQFQVNRSTITCISMPSIIILNNERIFQLEAYISF